MSQFEIGEYVQSTFTFGDVGKRYANAKGTVIKVNGSGDHLVSFDDPELEDKLFAGCYLIKAKRDDLRPLVYKYLTNRPNTYRKAAFTDLAEGEFFFVEGEEGQKEHLEEYLKDNPQGFCDEGVARARKAFGLENNTKVKATVILEFDSHVDDLSEIVSGLEYLLVGEEVDTHYVRDATVEVELIKE